jgi:predicted O-methyltransferase YrrM
MLSQSAVRFSFASMLHRTLYKNPRNHFILSRLGRSGPGLDIADAIRALSNEPPERDGDWIASIEAQRARHESSEGPLNDGTLSNAGPYDNVTVRHASTNSKGRRESYLLYCLTRSLRPRSVVELGTNLGISSSYIAAALQENGDSGHIVTLDASPYRQRIAVETHRNLGLSNVSYVNGLFTDTLENTLNTLGTVDLAFIDGHHEYLPTLDYCDKIYKHSHAGTIFVFDDIRWSDGMRQAWRELQKDPRFNLVVDLNKIGVCSRQGTPRHVSGVIRPF